jgi:DNA (cytosine-5)-methyltransferase 1
MKQATAVGLFAGIGGIEAGLRRIGFETSLLCEIDPAARRVLEHRFPNTEIHDDIRTLRGIPSVDIVAAGFPCQDLSQAGRTAGISGKNSGLVAEVFRLLASARRSPRWLLLENVPFMLHLERGRAMRFLVASLEAQGFMWAYRVVDTRAFGLPQRRQRVLLVASRSEDPRSVLFHGDAIAPPTPAPDTVACGFYWTEGFTGLGWAVDAVPTLKGGSTVGIPSPPAIRRVDRSIVTPEIRDAERLQGFPPDWTAPACPAPSARKGPRWKLIGNAVSVPVGEWVARRLLHPAPYDDGRNRPLFAGASWPKAAWGRKGEAYRVEISTWPVRHPYRHLEDFLEFPTAPLSARATRGFLDRVATSRLRFPKGFERDVAAHLELMASAFAPA